MKNIKWISIVFIMLLISGVSAAQSETKSEDKKIRVTGITGESIKEPSELDRSEKVIKKITKQILSDKLVAHKKELSYMLNNEEFIVNGVKQPSEIHQKYKNKYIKEKVKWNICKDYEI